jgi:tetratricopeptide (TPR) repeat protein
LTHLLKESQVAVDMKASFLLILMFLLPQLQQSGNLNEAIHLYQRGKFKEAVRFLEQLKKPSPDEHEIRFWLGKSYIKIRKWGDAVKEMEKAVELEPSNSQYHLWLGRASGFHAEHSSFIRAPFRARRVVKEFEIARDLAPEDLDVRFDLLEYYLNAPGFLGGGKEKAEAEAEVISKLDPKKGYNARATIYRKNENWELTRKELTQATIDYPNDADAWKDLADYLLDRRDFADALNCAQKALALNAESKQSQLIVAASEIRLQKNPEHAAEILQDLAGGTLADEEPAFETVYYWLGEYYLAKGDEAKARQAFESALDFDPDYSMAKDSLSRLK